MKRKKAKRKKLRKIAKITWKWKIIRYLTANRLSLIIF